MAWSGYKTRRDQGKVVSDHRFLWEQHHGRAIPPGHMVHHRDGDRLNNAIENLQLVTFEEHRRIHSGWTSIQGRWHKRCTMCSQMIAVKALKRSVCDRCRKSASARRKKKKASNG